MARKIIHILFGACAFAGFLLLIGTAGASDFNDISIGTILKQSGVAIAMFAGGMIGSVVTDY